MTGLHFSSSMYRYGPVVTASLRLMFPDATTIGPITHATSRVSTTHFGRSRIVPTPQSLHTDSDSYRHVLQHSSRSEGRYPNNNIMQLTKYSQCGSDNDLARELLFTVDLVFNFTFVNPILSLLQDAYPKWFTNSRRSTWKATTC